MASCKTNTVCRGFFSQLTDPESIKRCIEECEARIEIGTIEEMLRDYLKVVMQAGN